MTKKILICFALLGTLSMGACASLNDITTHAGNAVTATKSVASDSVTIIDELVQTAVALIGPVTDVINIIGTL